MSKIINEIKNLPDISRKGETSVIISFDIGDDCSNEFPVADLKTLATNHERLLAAARDVIEWLDPEAPHGTPIPVFQSLMMAVAECEKE